MFKFVTPNLCKPVEIDSDKSVVLNLGEFQRSERKCRLDEFHRKTPKRAEKISKQANKLLKDKQNRKGQAANRRKTSKTIKDKRNK